MTETLKPLHTKWAVSLGLGVLGSLVVTLVVLAFLWPTKTVTPHNLPVSVSGSETIVTAFEAAAEEKLPDAFDFVAADDREQAVSQIQTRETYGAIVLGDGSVMPEVLTAPAASASATQILNSVALTLQSQVQQQVAAAGGDASAVKVTVTPIVPLAETDPSGTGLAAASFPMTMGGMIGGILISLLVVGVIRRLVALAGFGIASGLILTLVLQSWFEFLQGDFWLNALAVGVSVSAISAFIIGCTSLLGRPGIAIGAIVMMLFANPLAAAAVPYQFIAQPWGAIGQFLPPGAANWLIRTLSYFPDADTAKQWWVLTGWLVLGVALALIGHFRSRQSMHVPEATLEETAAHA